MNNFSLKERNLQILVENMVASTKTLNDLLSNCRFLLVSEARFISQALTIEIFKLDPKVLRVVYLLEKNAIELVCDIRGNEGSGTGEFKTFATNCGSIEFEALRKRETWCKHYIIKLYFGLLARFAYKKNC